jgi:proton glutamate symport protein
MLRSLSFWVLAMLAAGIAVGAAINAWAPGLAGAAEIVEAAGRLWLNALRMTVIPLIVALLVTGVAALADAVSAGRLAARAILIFAVMLVSAAVYVALVFPAMLALWPADEAAAAAMIAGAGSGPVAAIAPPAFADFLATLAPSNPVRAAAEDAILPLVVFAVLFGFAVTRLPVTQRATLTDFFKALADAMIVIVRWVLLLAPAGVFALSLGVGLRSGAGAVGLLLHYVVMVSAITAGVTILAVLFALVWGRVNPVRFFAGIAPVQAVAISTQSSIASLPLMVQRSRDALGVSPGAANLVLPLAVAIFRMTSAVANVSVALFIAHLYGIELTPLQLASGCAVALMVSVGTVGLPGQVSFFTSMAPICLALGVPMELLPILLAVEVIPDIFRTVGNVTADMAAVVIADRRKDQPAG